jgi:hypothetical protein
MHHADMGSIGPTRASSALDRLGSFGPPFIQSIHL